MFARDVAVPVYGVLACVKGVVVAGGACVGALVCVVSPVDLRVHGAGPSVACRGVWRVLLRVPSLDHGMFVWVVALVAVVVRVRLADVSVSWPRSRTLPEPPAFVPASCCVPPYALLVGPHPLPLGNTHA